VDQKPGAGHKPFTFYWLAQRLETLALRRTDGVLCNSQYTEDLAKPFARRIWRLPNALRERFFCEPICSPPSGSGKPIFLNIGVVSVRKQQNELLKVARELDEEGISFELQFLGHAGGSTAYEADSWT